MQEKLFFLENQCTKQSQLINWKVCLSGKEVNLSRLLRKIPGAKNKVFKIYNPQKDSYVKFGNRWSSHPFVIPHHLLSMSVIIIRYKDGPVVQNQDSFMFSDDDSKKERSKERTIGEVIQIVEQWRKLQRNSSSGKKRTLKQSADILGVSKKSLDDYYYQLRVAQKFGFDFQSHLDDKIGLIRAFIKSNQPQRKIQGRNVRHPKKLKIIEKLSKNSQKSVATKAILQDQLCKKQTSIFCSKQEEMQHYKEYPPQIQNEVNNFEHLFTDEEGLFQQNNFSPSNNNIFIDFEKQLYQQFSINFDDPVDPYLTLFEKSYNKSRIEDELL